MVLPLGAVGTMITWFYDFSSLVNLDISSYGWASVLNLSCDFKKFSYLQLWIDWDYQIWTADAPREKSMKLLSSDSGDVTTTWLHYFDKFSYLQLWIAYDPQIWIVVAPFEEEFLNRRKMVQNSRWISSRYFKSVASLVFLKICNLVLSLIILITQHYCRRWKQS